MLFTSFCSELDSFLLILGIVLFFAVVLDKVVKFIISFSVEFLNLFIFSFSMAATFFIRARTDGSTSSLPSSGTI